MRNTFYYLLFLLLGLLPLLGQDDSSGDQKSATVRKSVTGRKAWFVCTSIPKDLENPVKLLIGKEIVELKLPRYMSSEAVEVPKEGQFQMVRPVIDPENPNKMTYLVLADITVPESVQEALIILVPVRKRVGNKVFNAMVQDLAGFKGGDRMFINMSDTHIGVRLGEDKVGVPAKRTKIYASPGLDKPMSMPIRYDFYHTEKKEWKLLTASTSVVYPTRREICIFNNGTRIGNVKKHSILFPVALKR